MYLYTFLTLYASAVMLTCRICPIFAISCVNGRNLDLLLKFLNALPPLSNGSEKEKIVQALTEHQARYCFVVLFHNVQVDIEKTVFSTEYELLQIKPG